MELLQEKYNFAHTFGKTSSFGKTITIALPSDDDDEFVDIRLTIEKWNPVYSLSYSFNPVWTNFINKTNMLKFIAKYMFLYLLSIYAISAKSIHAKNNDCEN